MKVRKAGRAACALIVRLGAFAATAADYPTRPIRYLVGFAPGGINDIMARIVGAEAQRSRGDSRSSSTTGPAPAAISPRSCSRESTPDGYTFMNISTAHAISQTLYTKLDYNLERDLTPVVVLGNSPLIMVVNAGLPVKNVAELVDLAKKRKLIYASGGVGVISHLGDGDVQGRRADRRDARAVQRRRPRDTGAAVGRSAHDDQRDPGAPAVTPRTASCA